MADTEIFTTQVPDGDFVVTERDTRWLVRRVVGDRASQTTWAFEGGQPPAVAQALIFARHVEPRRGCVSTNAGTAWSRASGPILPDSAYSVF